jgi:hypothetical protein
MFKNVDGCMELNCVKGRFRKEITNKKKKRCIEEEDFVAIVEKLQHEIETSELELVAMVAQNLWLR